MPTFVFIQLVINQSGQELVIYIKLFLFIQMLIKTEVKRRTQSLNQYILELKEKVYDRRYKQAKILLTHRKQSVNNSYMAPYDPNVYLLDSLKSKNEKLMRQREMVEQEILRKLQDINRIKIKRGYRRDYPTNKNQTQQNFQFIPKMTKEQVGIYVSRFPLKLEDVDKIDYEIANLQTDFHLLKIIVDDSSISLAFKQVLTIESEQTNILISWNTDKADSKSYVILRFERQEDRKYWARCINFAKLISESELKQKLFFKEEENYMINVKPEQTKPNMQTSQTSNNNKFTGLNIGANRSSALDRLRRKSQYYPTLPTINNNLGLINRSKLRKISEDLTMKQSLNRNNYMYQRKVGNDKSQKSFEDELSQANSMEEKKEQNKKQTWKDQPKKNEVSSKIQKLKEEKEKMMNQNNNTQSNRQIFFNQSSIHWIQEENQQMNSISSKPSRNVVGKNNILDGLSKDQPAHHQQVEKSQHISQAPAEIEESPLLPYSIRDKRKDKNVGCSDFQVRINEVPMTKHEKPFKLKDLDEIRSQRSQRSQRSRRIESQQKNPIIKNDETQNPHDSSFGNQIEAEQDQQKPNQIESINQQSADDESESDRKQIENSKAQVQDKSQDIVSENQNSETQSRKYGLDDLKSGIILLKCSTNAWNPHIKKLSLSNNDTQLCYKDENGQNLKKINISEIQKIEYNAGIATPGISKHIKNFKKERCFVIRYKQDKKTKLLQFYLPNDKKLDDLQNFYSKLNSYVVYKNSQL